MVVAYPCEAKPSALENDGDQTDQLSRYVTDRDPALRNQIVASHAGLAYRWPESSPAGANPMTTSSRSHPLA